MPRLSQTGGETGKRLYWERFHEPANLADWFAVSPLQLEDVQVSPEEFRLGLSLREAIWRVAEAIRQKEMPLAEDIEAINRVASAPDLPRSCSRTVWSKSGAPLLPPQRCSRSSPAMRSICSQANCALAFVHTKIRTVA